MVPQGRPTEVQQRFNSPRASRRALISTPAIIKKIQEQHPRLLWLSISSGSCIGVILHKAVLLNLPFLYEEMFRYPYRRLVRLLGGFYYPYRPRLATVAPLYRSETLDCAILPQLDAAASGSTSKRAVQYRGFFRDGHVVQMDHSDCSAAPSV